jgi:brefeldin A-inhibited guanine nucleotide-exchange protein
MQGTIGTGSTSLVVIALDCLGKLISYNYVSHDPKAMESVVDLICECFVGEGTDEKIQLQIIKVHSLKRWRWKKNYTLFAYTPLL